MILRGSILASILPPSKACKVVRARAIAIFLVFLRLAICHFHSRAFAIGFILVVFHCNDLVLNLFLLKQTPSVLLACDAEVAVWIIFDQMVRLLINPTIDPIVHTEGFATPCGTAFV